MAQKRRRFTSEFKAKVAMEAMKNQQTLQELSSQYEVHPNMVSQWKKELHERAYEIFSQSKPVLKERNSSTELYEQIGRLQVENAWLKKKLSR